MSFLAPWLLVAAGAAALGAVLLHLFALQRPPAAPLPTARFVPDAPARAASRSVRPTDRTLLLLRVLALLLLGAAFARPVVTPARAPVRQILLLDRSRAVASTAELRDSALVLLRPGDAVLLLDSAVAPVAPLPDSVAAALAEPVEVAARLSAGLVAAQRLAAALADSTDSVRILVVSPLAREAFDAATLAVRGEWPGALRLVPVAARLDTLRPHRVALASSATDDDELAIAARLAGLVRADGTVRLLGRAPNAADSTWARAGGVLLVWPAAGAEPAGWTQRAVPDTAGGVATDDAVLVAPLARRVAAPASEARAVPLRWADGAPAAVDTPLGAGCVRQVAVALPEAGDLALRGSFHRLLASLLAPCGGARDWRVASAAALEALAGEGAAAVPLARSRARPTPLVPWLLAAGLVLLLMEPLLRRNRRVPA